MGIKTVCVKTSFVSFSLDVDSFVLILYENECKREKHWTFPCLKKSYVLLYYVIIYDSLTLKQFILKVF